MSGSGMVSSARWHRPVGAALVLLLLAGCGFRPLYGSGAIVRDRGEPGTVSLSDVQIEPIPNRRGQELRNRLIDRFYGDGRPASPTYALAVTNLRTSITKLGDHRQRHEPEYRQIQHPDQPVRDP